VEERKKKISVRDYEDRKEGSEEEEEGKKDKVRGWRMTR
jgi:hypothetical protein